eukprot:COSAG05_NODE_517_length_9060_cov_7.019306_11_plen_254_part_00
MGTGTAVFIQVVQPRAADNGKVLSTVYWLAAVKSEAATTAGCIWLLCLAAAPAAGFATIADKPQFQQPCTFHAVGRRLLLGATEDETTDAGVVFLDTKRGIGGLVEGNGEQVSSSLIEARIGDEDHPLVPPGLMLGLKHMRAGEHATLRVDSRFGCGQSGWVSERCRQTGLLSFSPSPSPSPSPSLSLPPSLSAARSLSVCVGCPPAQPPNVPPNTALEYSISLKRVGPAPNTQDDGECNYQSNRLPTVCLAR